MLVLSRKRDESIVIGENIVLTIVDIRGDKVRLGVEAPSTVSVHRKEVHDELQREHAQRDTPEITASSAESSGASPSAKL